MKSHHYIISFDPRDGTDNGLTVDRAQELGEQFCKEHFPGHQALICTHPDGHNPVSYTHLDVYKRQEIELEKEIEIKREIEKVRPETGHPSHTYGHYQNVFLTDEELADLQVSFPAVWEQYIEKLSEYMASTCLLYTSQSRRFFSFILNQRRPNTV